jgi:hypothetical protein
VRLGRGCILRASGKAARHYTCHDEDCKGRNSFHSGLPMMIRFRVYLFSGSQF